MDKIFLKIWSADRLKKCSIVVSDDTMLYENAILKGKQSLNLHVYIDINFCFISASSKLQLDGAILVLNSDGTVIDDNETLQLISQETLILLQKDEVWRPESPNFGTNSADTLTDILSSSDSILSQPLDAIQPSTSQNWQHFNIPWEKVSSIDLDKCQQGLKKKYNYSHSKCCCLRNESV